MKKLFEIPLFLSKTNVINFGFINLRYFFFIYFKQEFKNWL